MFQTPKLDMARHPVVRVEKCFSIESIRLDRIMGNPHGRQIQEHMQHVI
jgi:hypothetical protein